MRQRVQRGAVDDRRAPQMRTQFGDVHQRFDTLLANRVGVGRMAASALTALWKSIAIQRRSPVLQEPALLLLVDRIAANIREPLLPSNKKQDEHTGCHQSVADDFSNRDG